MMINFSSYLECFWGMPRKLVNHTSGFICKGIFVLWKSIYYLLTIYLFLLSFIVLGAHCDIYKSFYSISKFSSPLPSFSFILPFPPFLEYFLQVSFFHFHICIHDVPTIFSLLNPFLISSPLSTVPT
jgi:hypothetical protein